MAEKSWYYVKDNKPVGPIPESKMREMFHAGGLSMQTLVWSQPMPNWMPASNIESFRLKASQTAEFTMQYRDNVSIKQSRLFRFKGTGFQCLWWGLNAWAGALLIIPAAWGAVPLYQWFVRNLEFSDGTTASFEGFIIPIPWMVVWIIRHHFYSFESGTQKLRKKQAKIILSFS